ncbi:unnamed protein product [Mytilus coruscus]|uniref:Uncharacterized protein n=1 Tax=Mytilus coruscus TaxID=42192 RepID=A0A6J8F470_MYTCO|nr:unnamed protein product [Mytilus coruscus]
MSSTTTLASIPPSYHHLPNMSSTTTLASILPSYHHLPTMSSTTPASLPHSSYQHLPTMSSTIPASHLSPQPMSYFPTATAHTHLPVPYMSSLYPTTTTTCQPQQSTIPSAPTFQMSTMPSATHFYTAEPLDQSLTIPSPSANKTTTTTADFSSYLPIDVNDCHDYEVFSPEIGSPTRKVLEREAVAMSKDEGEMECILPQLLGQDPPSTCSNLDARPAIPNDTKKTDEDLNHQVIQALANFTKSQQLILQELGHLNRSVTTLSSDISFLRGQFRQQERIINRQQRVLDRRNTVNNLQNRIPTTNARTTPYNRNTAAGTQKKQKLKSVVVKDN